MRLTPNAKEKNVSKFIVELHLDGYDTAEEAQIAEREFIYDQLNFSGSCVKITPYSESDLKTAHEMIRELREALELYADERNWRQTEEADGWLYNERFDPGWTDPERFKSGNFSNKDLEDGDGTYSSCGKRARAVLQKWQGKLNENT